ncbi:MAG: metal ABC transporter ATP-binding protein [Thermoplasmata archaeon]
MTGPSGLPLLSVTHLTVQRDRRLVLDDVSFDVPRGARLAIVGPNGAGKTTLLRVLLRAIPFRGEVRWAVPVRIGYVPQKLVETDIPLSVEEFLAMKCPGDYAECLRTVGLDHGLIRETIGTLSGGELQRVLIAWAIVDHPEVLLFDEPTSNVDAGSQEVILDTLSDIQRKTGVTLLMVTHDVHAVHHFATWVLALDRRVRFDGSPEDLLANLPLATSVFGIDHHHEPHAEGSVRTA